MRAHFEGYMNAAQMFGKDRNGGFLKNVWSMVCSEVQLRFCRDVVAGRLMSVESGEKQAPEKIAKDVKLLGNLKIQWCGFWSPLNEESWNEMAQLEGCESHFLEMCLVDQLLERKVELQEMADKAKDEEQKTVLFENMPDLVWSWLQKKSGSSGSYGGKSYCGAPALKIE